MAIGAGSLIEVALNQRGFDGGMLILNVFQYEVTAIAGGTTAANIAEGWWNDVKTAYRAIVNTGSTNWFRTVRVTELNNPSGDFAEWDVPSGEQAGTRVLSGELMPPFNAVGVRLLVGSRVTRPGQKRFTPVGEVDNVTGVLQASLRGLIVTLMNNLSTQKVLGAPALGTTLFPIVTRKNVAGTVTAWQDVIGYLINNDITSQNTRKYGRGR